MKMKENRIKKIEIFLDSLFSVTIMLQRVQSVTNYSKLHFSKTIVLTNLNENSFEFLSKYLSTDVLTWTKRHSGMRVQKDNPEANLEIKNY